MSESKHTKGPWFGGREKPAFVPLKAISCERLGFSIGWVNGHREEEAAANARLIASAPELLEALEFVSKYIAMRATKDEEFPSQLTNAVRNAIAKATAT